MKILLCTNEELLLTTLEYRFRKQGWQLVVRSGRQPLADVVKKQAPDLIVVDLELPDYEGLDLVQALCRDLPDRLPVIAAAPLEEDKLVLEALRLGADDFIVKPFKPDELALRIHRLLGGRKLDA
jgi:DNA-binding response OmpR family regulator